MMSPHQMNQKLLKIYGNCPIVGKPKYRVVRSDEQVEKRTGSYKVFTESGIYLRDEVGTREIRKYWYIKVPCWMLERVEPNTDRFNVIAEKFTYEPLLPFLDGENNPVPLQWNIAERICGALQNAERKIKTPQELEEDEKKHDAVMDDKAHGILDSPDPIKPLPTFKKSSIMSDMRLRDKLKIANGTEQMLVKMTRSL
jgi:hypothetical protein